MCIFSQDPLVPSHAPSPGSCQADGMTEMSWPVEGSAEVAAWRQWFTRTGPHPQGAMYTLNQLLVCG